MRPSDDVPFEVFAYSTDGVEEQLDLAKEPLQAALAAGKLIWVRLFAHHAEAALAKVNAIFGVHSLVLEDLANQSERPKIEAFDGQSLVVLRTPHPGKGRVEFDQLGILWGDRYVVTVETARAACFEPVAQRLRHPTAKLRSRPTGMLVHALIDGTIEAFGPWVEGFREKLEALEATVISRPESSTIYALHALHRDLERVRHVLVISIEVLVHALRSDAGLFDHELLPYLRDTRDLAARLLDEVNGSVHLLTDLVELRNSQLDQRMNEIMAWLSLVSTLFIPLSFVAGLYGMNFANMPELRWRFGYPAVLFLMLCIALAFLAYFRHRGWLGRGGRGPFGKGRGPNRH
jgi:magnesium transporter